MSILIGKGKKEFITVMAADGSGVSTIIEKAANLQTESGAPVVISSDSRDDLLEAVYTSHPSGDPPGLDEDNNPIPELPPQARALAAIENHAHVGAGRVKVQKQ